ncbi:MAG: ATP phosphoribosyltransferase, partial [Bacteroidetes bacterium]
MTSDQPLKIAIQKSGRLSDDSRQLLRECGISIQNGKNALIARARNFPLEVLYLRDDDIPQYVADGTADLGIVGQNVVAEAGFEVDEVRALGFGGCRLSLAVPKSVDYPGLEWFGGKKIATSYPNILSRFLSEKGIRAEVHTISGSVEIAPNIGLADGIADLVSSGSTLFSNGLKEVEVIMRSEAVLVARPRLPEGKKRLLDRLVFRIDAVQRAARSKYVVLNAPNDRIEAISRILPGMKSPTVVPLAEPGWSALHSVINEDEFWEVIDELKEAGAQGILVVPIE